MTKCFYASPLSGLVRLCLSTVCVLSVLMISAGSIYASNLTSLSDVMSSQSVGFFSDHEISFITPSGVQAGQTISISFPAGFDTSSVDYTDIDLLSNGTSLPLSSTPSNAIWGVGFGGVGNRVLTLASGSGTILAGATVIIRVGENAVDGNRAIRNPMSQGNYIIGLDISGSTDIGGIGIIITPSQIGLNGQVDPTLSFAISNTSMGFGTLGGTSLRYATSDGNGSSSIPGFANPVRFTASTNASNGLRISIKDQGDGTFAGLWSPAPILELIPAAASSSIVLGQKSFGVYGKNASNLTVNEGFDNDGSSDVSVSRNFQTLASSNSPVDQGAVDLSLVLAVDALTKAGNYSDTITVICSATY